jgi:DNA-binding NarL/FixJ family response regulator
MSIVLIVDDYPAARKGLRNLLENQCSAVCIEAINGLDTIAKAEVSHPDLIILDLGLLKSPPHRLDENRRTHLSFGCHRNVG